MVILRVLILPVYAHAMFSIFLCCLQLLSPMADRFLSTCLFFIVISLIYLLLIYYLFFGCVGSSFLCEGFLQPRQAGATLHRAAWASIAASPVAEHRLQMRRLSSCGSRAQLFCGMWDLPRPGLEPVSPALTGRLSTTAPPGKPWAHVFYLLRCVYS